MTVKQVAASEQVSERQIQRYIAQGFQGHKLAAVRVGKSFQIAESVYMQWRIACGFDTVETQPQRGATSLQVSPCEDEVEPPSPPGDAPAPCAEYPPWPMPACPNGGVLTNVPNEHSSNWPHPEACRIHAEEELHRQTRGNL